MPRTPSKGGGATSDGYHQLNELVSFASLACQTEWRLLKLRLERARAIEAALTHADVVQKKIDAFRRELETEHTRQAAREPTASVTSRRTEAIRRLAKTYQKLKAQLDPVEQKAIRAVFKSSGVTAAIREAREMIRNSEKRLAGTPPARGPSPRRALPVERRPSPEERLVRAKLAVLRAYVKHDELEHAAAMHDLDDLLPREFEISRTRIEELYQETQGARRPFFVRDLVRLVPDAERVEILAELGGLYDMSLALLVQEAEATAPDAPHA